MICAKCKKEFKLNKFYKNDNLCSKCRSRKKYLELSKHGKYRKTKSCPGCGKEILKQSNLCLSCFQTGNKNHAYKKGFACKDRTCSCGNIITPGSGKGMCWECYSKKLKGKTNPNYKLGHYLNDIRNTKEYKNWRLTVFRRDGFACKKCGKSKSGFLQAHHIRPKRDFPNLVYEVSNGITLCKTCHENVSQKEYDYVDYFTSLINYK